MKTILVTRPNGSTFSIQVPPDATQDQIREAAIRHEARAAQLTHPRAPAETPALLGPPGGPVGPGSGTFSERMSSGGAENLPELAARLGLPMDSVYGDATGNRYIKRPGSSEWTRLNPPGIDVGDVGEMVGSVGPQTLGAILATMAVPELRAAGLLKTMATGMLGGAAGKGAEEGVETIQGTQRQDPVSAAGTALGAGVQEAAGAGLGNLMGRFMPLPGLPRPLSIENPAARANFDTAVALAQQHPELASAINAGAIRSATGLGPFAGPTVQRVLNQVENLTGALSNARQPGIEAAGRLVNATRPDYQDLPTVNRTLSDYAQRQADSIRGFRQGMFPSGEAGAQAVKRGLAEGNEDLQREVSAAYAKTDAAAAREVPVFDAQALQQDLAPSSKLTRTDLRNVLDAQGRPIMANVTSYIEAADPGPAQLQRMRDILGNMDFEQTNYDALKRIRTQIGNMIEGWPYERGTAKEARALWGKVTEVLRNPKNLPAGSEYVTNFDRATGLAKRRFELLESNAVRQVFNSEGTTGLVRHFASSPESMFSPSFRELLSRGPASERDLFRRSVQSAILSSEKPDTALQAVKGKTDPKAYDFLFSDPGERDYVESTAKDIERFWESPTGKMFEARNKQLDAARIAVSAPQHESEVVQMLKNMTPDEKKAYRDAVIEDAIDGSFTKYDRNNNRMIDPKALRAKIDDYTKRGIWAVLPQADRTLIKGIGPYYKQFLQNMSDMGASLEGASVAADLKGMMTGQFGQVFKSGRQIGEARMIAEWATNQKRANSLLRRVNALPRDNRKWVAASLIGNPIFWSAIGESGRWAEDRLLNSGGTKTPSRAPGQRTPPP